MGLAVINIRSTRQFFPPKLLQIMSPTRPPGRRRRPSLIELFTGSFPPSPFLSRKNLLNKSFFARPADSPRRVIVIIATQVRWYQGCTWVWEEEKNWPKIDPKCHPPTAQGRSEGELPTSRKIETFFCFFLYYIRNLERVFSGKARSRSPITRRRGGRGGGALGEKWAVSARRFHRRRRDDPFLQGKIISTR